MIIIGSVFSFIVNADTVNKSEILCKSTNEWAGYLRIEGKSETIWSGRISVTDSNITAENASTGLMENYYISYPSILGSLDEASKKAGFSYYAIYYPSWDAFYIKSIAGDSEWWHYWVDYDLPMIGAGKYELSQEDEEILWGYLENWEAHALKISIDKKIVKKNEEFTVSVFNETGFGVKNATVYIGTNTFLTGNNGNVTIKLSKSGIYEIYSEKEGFVRSEKVSLQVKIKGVSKIKSLPLYNYLFDHGQIYQNFLNTFLNYKLNR
jgi:hypothetical protein